jgi:hypothetical protein
LQQPGLPADHLRQGVLRRPERRPHSGYESAFPHGRPTARPPAFRMSASLRVSSWKTPTSTPPSSGVLNAGLIAATCRVTSPSRRPAPRRPERRPHAASGRRSRTRLGPRRPSVSRTSASLRQEVDGHGLPGAEWSSGVTNVGLIAARTIPGRSERRRAVRRCPERGPHCGDTTLIDCLANQCGVLRRSERRPHCDLPFSPAKKGPLSGHPAPRAPASLQPNSLRRSPQAGRRILWGHHPQPYRGCVVRPGYRPVRNAIRSPEHRPHCSYLPGTEGHPANGPPTSPTWASLRRVG